MGTGHLDCFHINFIPLIPTKCWLITAYGDMELPAMHWPAVLHGYSKALLALLVAGMMLFALFAGIETRLFSEGIMLLVGLFGIIGLGALSFYGVNTYLNQCFVGAHPLEEHLLGALFDDQGDGSWEDVP